MLCSVYYLFYCFKLGPWAEFTVTRLYEPKISKGVLQGPYSCLKQLFLYVSWKLSKYAKA